MKKKLYAIIDDHLLVPNINIGILILNKWLNGACSGLLKLKFINQMRKANVIGIILDVDEAMQLHSTSTSNLIIQNI